jgi:cell division protein FtsB
MPDDVQPSPSLPRPIRRTDRIRIVRMCLLAAAAVIAIDALVGDRGFLATARARREHEQLAAAIAERRAENAELGETIRRLSEDQAAIEEVARRELGLLRPGERVFVLREGAPPSPP